MDGVIPIRKWDIHESEAESDIVVIIETYAHTKDGAFFSFPIYDASRISIILCFEIRGILVEIKGILVEIRGILVEITDILIEIRGMWINAKYKLNKIDKLQIVFASVLSH